MSLTWISQDDFAAGVLRSPGRALEPGVGVANAVNGLFDDDGDCYLRGNTRAHSNALAAPLTFLWTGDLGGLTGLASTASGFYQLSGGVLTAMAGGTPVTRPVKPAIIAGELFLPNGTSWKGVGTLPTGGQLPAPLPGMSGEVHVATCGERLIVAQGRFVRFSAGGDPHSFGADDYHELPGGTVIRGLAAIRDTLLVFSSYGIWAIENLALDLTDDQGNPQQVVQKLLPELGLLHESGLADWSGRIVVPCADRCFLIDTISAPTPISDSIAPLYMEHIRAGRLPGGAKVFRNHYFLPWLNAGGQVASLMVCRLNRPVNGRATYYPWSIFTGHAAQMVMGDIAAVTSSPTMLVAHRDGSVVDFVSVFDPDDQAAHDVDGSDPEFDFETRDFPTGNGQPNHVRALRLTYTLTPLEGVDASIGAAFSYGSTAQDYETLRTTRSYADVKTGFADYAAVLRGPILPSAWGPSAWAEDRDRFWQPLEERAVLSPGLDPAQWRLAQPKRVRYTRVRFRCTDPVAKLVIHRVGFGVRPATHER